LGKEIFKASAHTDPFVAIRATTQYSISGQKHFNARTWSRSLSAVFSYKLGVFPAENGQRENQEKGKAKGKSFSTPTPSIWPLHNRLPVAPL